MALNGKYTIEKNNLLNHTFINLENTLVWKGGYSSSVTYSPNNVVFYSGSSYICVAISLGNLPTNVSFWNILAQSGNVSSGFPLIWLNLYSNSTSYVVNNLVQYNGSAYICILANIGQIPSTANSIYWKIFASAGTNGPTWFGDYSNSTSYVVNNLVQYDGSTYVCILENMGQIPSTANSIYWKIFASAGTNGTNGLNGTNGIKGDKGDDGDTGLQGKKGDKGDNGADASIASLFLSAISVVLSGITYTTLSAWISAISASVEGLLQSVSILAFKTQNQTAIALQTTFQGDMRIKDSTGFITVATLASSGDFDTKKSISVNPTGASPVFLVDFLGDITNNGTINSGGNINTAGKLQSGEGLSVTNSYKNIISNSGTTTTIGDYGCSVVVRGNISFVEDRPIHLEDIYQSIGDGIPVNYPMQNKYFQNLNPLIIFS